MGPQQQLGPQQQRGPGTEEVAAAQLAEDAELGAEERALVAAVIENRAGEVGLALLDSDAGALLLLQHVEPTRTFALTLDALARYNPGRLLVVAEAQGTGVSKATEQWYNQVPLPRSMWDDSAGYLTLTKYATAEARGSLEAGMLQSMASTYLAYAAAGALLKYLAEGEAGVVLVAGSLDVRSVGSSTHMHIDRATAQSLELIQPIKVGTSSTKLKNMTLFRVLDRNKTKCGARLLRANLQQPLRDAATLELRYDAVGELAGDDELAFSVSSCLRQLPKDLDRMCGSLSLRPTKSEAGTLRRMSAMIQSFILLHETLAVLPPLAEALAGAQCQLLRQMAAACGHAAFAELRGELEGVLEEDVHSAKNAFLNRTQQCFAVKSGVDGFLDVARQTFCRVSEQVHELASQLRLQHNLPHMRVHYTAKKGFYFSIGGGGAAGAGGQGNGGGRRKHPRDLEEEEDEEAAQGGDEAGCPPGSSARQQSQHSQRTGGTAAARAAGGRGAAGGQQQQPAAGAGRAVKVPAGFVVLQHCGRVVHVTTNELNALNSRLRDSSNDCMVLTEQVMEGLTQRIAATYLPLLHRLVDNIALLDMLAGFSLVASEGVSGGSGGASAGGAAGGATLTGGGDGVRPYVRPVLTEAGPIALVEARHPVLERLDSQPYQPNDTYLALNSSFHIITGPNMSGKSTYLRQVALCVVMAQVGAFVPATFASLTPCDRLLSRLGTGDSLETCSSSFMVEMQEAAYLLHAATPRSLVLVDELGRATSTADGVGLAWAVAERLIALGCPTLFATHFTQLTELAALYPSAKAWHFNVDASANRLDFSWQLRAGGGKGGHYGLALARAVGFPPDVLQAAGDVVEELDASEGQRIQAWDTPDAADLAAVYDIVHKLQVLALSKGAEGGEGELRTLQKQLRHLKTEAREALAAAAAETGRLPGL